MNSAGVAANGRVALVSLPLCTGSCYVVYMDLYVSPSCATRFVVFCLEYKVVPKSNCAGSHCCSCVYAINNVACFQCSL